MPVVAVINYKGGVGKTTITANLAAELAYRGKKILLLDLDSQASLTFSFVRPDAWEQNLAQAKTIKAWFDSFETGSPMSLDSLLIEPPEVKRIIGARGELYLIPSHLGLINADLELATKLGGGTLKQAKINFLKVHRRLTDGLSGLVDNFDVVLIDCPPNFNVVTKTAIVASDHILIPAKPDYLSTLGIDYLQRNLRKLVRDFNDFATHDNDGSQGTIAPDLLGVVFTMIQVYAEKPIAAQRPYMRQTRDLNIPVFDTWIRENKTLFGNAPEYGVPVALQSYGLPTYAEIVGELEKLASEFMERL